MKKYVLEITVFVGGAVVMILELVATRILAPYVGTSIIVWTGLIGVILGSLSLGYWQGGVLADKKPTYKVLSLIIFSAALLIGLVNFVREDILTIIQNNFVDLRSKSIISTIVLFAPQSILLGMILPFAVKLKLRSLGRTGRTTGGIYAFSTIGSIVGTFAAGFFLIAYLGITKILALLSILLLAISFLIFLTVKGVKKNKKLLLFILYFILGLAFAFMPTRPLAFVDVETLYNRVLLKKIVNKQGRPLLLLKTGPMGSQSAMFLDNNDDSDLVAGSTKYYRLAGHFKPDIRRTLMIGGGGYSYPKDFLKSNPEATVDVVEIDPGITQLAKEYFRLEDDSRLTIYHQDGREFLNRSEGKYDVVFIDAFRHEPSLPFQLTTFEAVESVHRVLEEDGVVILNIYSSILGDTGKFLRAEVKTYENVFPQVYLFPVSDPNDANRVQNIILIALKSSAPPVLASKNEELDNYLEHLWVYEVPKDMPILTDDLAPVEQYMLSLQY